MVQSGLAPHASLVADARSFCGVMLASGFDQEAGREAKLEQVLLREPQLRVNPMLNGYGTLLAPDEEPVGTVTARPSSNLAAALGADDWIGLVVIVHAHWSALRFLIPTAFGED